MNRVMKRIDIGQLAQFLGNLGVIASVVFLALEINQNTTLLEAEARTARAQIRIDAYDHLANNADLIRARIKDRNGETLTEFDEQLLRSSTLAMLTRWQYVFGEWQAGLLQEDELPVADWRISIMGSPVNHKTWEEVGRVSFKPDFVDWMESNVVGMNQQP